MTIEERAYQTIAITNARQAFVGGAHAVLIVSPTGSGKTVLVSRIIRSAVSRRSRVALYAHRRELRDQAARTLRRIGVDVDTQGARTSCLVQVTGPQVALARRKLPEADIVVFDEAHHYVADEWGQIPLAYLKAGARIIGLSATPERGDGVGLGGLFDALVVAAQIDELTGLGHLVPCEVIYPRSRTMLALDPWEAYQRFSPGKSAVVFAPHVKAAEDFALDFRKNGIAAGVVHGNLEDEDRDGVLDQFERGKISVIVNVMVLTEGWDCPRAEVCILARRVASPSLYLQMVGRVLRPFPGKTSAMMIDLCGNRELHGDPDEPRDWHLEGAACTRRDSAGGGVRRCRTCQAEIPPDADRCPDPACGRPVPEQITPTADNVEMLRADKAARAEEKRKAIAGLADDKRVKILSGLYVKGIRAGSRRGSAHHAYRSMTGHFPDAALAALAWRAAGATIHSERGDAYEHPSEDQSS